MARYRAGVASQPDAGVLLEVLLGVRVACGVPEIGLDDPIGEIQVTGQEPTTRDTELDGAVVVDDRLGQRARRH